MPIFYHVDRQSHLSEGQILTLTHPVIQSDIPDLQNFGRQMFPEGVSRHGDQYFYSASRTDEKEPILEILLEYYRRAYCSYRPSRFQSWFGVESFDDALYFQKHYCQGKGIIWQVEAEQYFKAQMSIISHRTVLVFSYLANLYWSGQAVPQASLPFWEILLVPPVKVLQKVQHDDIRS
jgi:hypothetical protein